MREISQPNTLSEFERITVIPKDEADRQEIDLLETINEVLSIMYEKTMIQTNQNFILV